MSRWQSIRSNVGTIYNTAKLSWQTGGKFANGLPYGVTGPGSEGFLHSIRRGVGDMLMVGGQHHMVEGKRYGGHLLSVGGLREIQRDVTKGADGLYRFGAKRSWGRMLGRTIGKAGLPALFLAQSISENGLWGGIKDSAESGAVWGAGTWAAKAMLANPLAIGAIAVTGAAYGAHKALKAGREYYRNSRRINFGNPIQDTYGTVATMRQAAVQAINSSKINGRSALGFEASLLHQ